MPTVVVFAKRQPVRDLETPRRSRRTGWSSLSQRFGRTLARSGSLFSSAYSGFNTPYGGMGGPGPESSLAASREFRRRVIKDVGGNRVVKTVRLPLKPIANTGGFRAGDGRLHLVAADGEEHLLDWALTFFEQQAPHDDVRTATAAPPAPRKTRRSALSGSDVRVLLQCRVIEPAPRSAVGRRLGHAFSVPKSDGVWARFILDDGENDLTSAPFPFNIMQPTEVVDMLLLRPYGVSCDSSNHFFQFALPESVRDRHAFLAADPDDPASRPRSRVYRMRVLSMGWRGAPFLAHAVTCGLSGTAFAARSAAPTSAVIIDNTLVTGETLAEARAAMDAVLARAAAVGLVIGDQDDTAVTGGVRFDHGGVSFDTSDGVRWRVKPRWAAKAAGEIAAVLRRSVVPPELLLRVAGLVQWYVRVCELPAAVVAAFDAHVSERARVWTRGVFLDDVLPAAARSDLIAAGQALVANQWYGRRRVGPLFPVWTDATRSATAFVVHELAEPGLTAASAPAAVGAERMLHDLDNMPFAELAAVLRAARRLGDTLKGRTAGWLVDCEPVVRILRKGRTASARLLPLLAELLVVLAARRTTMQVAKVSTVEQIADDPSRGVPLREDCARLPHGLAWSRPCPSVVIPDVFLDRLRSLAACVPAWI